jgi:signal transduction histidine kinase
MANQTSPDRPSVDAGAPPRRFPWWTLALAVIVDGGSVGAQHQDSDHPLLLVAALSGVAALAALAAQIRPRASVLVNGLAVGAYFAWGLGNGPIFLTVPLVTYLAAGRARPRPLLMVMVPALALILGGLTVRSQVHGASAAVAFWQGSGLTALALGGGVLGWWLTDRRAGRREQAQRTATEERLRMAQDLHDGVGHGLAVISMHAAVALHVLDKFAGESGESGEAGRPALGVTAVEEQLRQSLEIIRDTGRESLDALRVQLAAISTGSGASRRPAPGLPELEDLLARVRTGGLAVSRRGDSGDVPEELGQAVYAVVQESLTNVLRHARAARAVVTLAREGEDLVVSIQDDGHGPGGEESGGAPGEPERNGAGMGIPGMRGRVERLGGTLESGFTEGGFLVRVRLPMPT